MNIFITNFYLVLYIFTKVNGDGVTITTKTDPLTISNDPKSSDTGADPKLDLNVGITTKDRTASITPPSKFDMKDFKITTLKSNHNEEDIEDCLATANPKMVEAVRKTLKNDGGRVDYVASEALHIDDEELKIAACLKKETMTTQANTLKADMKFDNKTATKTPLETVEEVEMKLEEKNKKGRRDTEYQFDPLEYYDETVTFDPNSCPDDVEVINLQIGELKQYDVECELLTHWIGLAETVMNM